MSFFPILEEKTLPELERLFLSDEPVDGIDPDEGDLWLQEIAFAIAKSGHDGIAFLLNCVPQMDAHRLRGAMLGLGSMDKNAAGELMDGVQHVLAEHVDHADPLVAAEAIDGLRHLGCKDKIDLVTPLLNHRSPYVVGSALRFLSAHCPAKAAPLLIEALSSPEPIIRQNAIDELDEMECREALPNIAGLLKDPDRHVRQAAEWAVSHLETKS